MLLDEWDENRWEKISEDTTGHPDYIQITSRKHPEASKSIQKASRRVPSCLAKSRGQNDLKPD